MIPYISIIIPVYKVEQYLRRCLDSIIMQNEQRFEILLIDDGSPDNSGAICDEYAQKDSRIRVFHKPNGGVSSARNLGLDNAKGKWICFVDGDDDLTQDYLTIPQEYAKCDIIQKGLIEYDRQEHSFYVSNKILSSQSDLFEMFLNERSNSPCDKFFSKELIADTRFDEAISIGEDFLFNLCLLSNVRQYGYCDKGLYRYWRRESSAMRATNLLKHIENWFLVCEGVFSITKNKSTANIAKSLLADTFIPSFFAVYSLLDQSQKGKYKKLINGISLCDLPFVSWKHKLKFALIKIRSLWL